MSLIQLQRSVQKDRGKLIVHRYRNEFCEVLDLGLLGNFSLVFHFAICIYNFFWMSAVNDRAQSYARRRSR